MKKFITICFCIGIATSAHADINRVKDSTLKCLSYNSAFNCETAIGEIETYENMYAKSSECKLELLKQRLNLIYVMVNMKNKETADTLKKVLSVCP